MSCVVVLIACVCQEKEYAVSIHRCVVGRLVLYYADVLLVQERNSMV